MSVVPHAVTLAANPCREDQAWCSGVWDLTGNATLAKVVGLAIGAPLAVLAIVLVGLFARWLLHRVIDRMVKRAATGVLPTKVGKITLGAPAQQRNSRRVQRAETMGSLLKSIATGAIVAIVVVMALSEVGFDIAPLIAGAGIVGVALGFGSQALVKDFLSGIFMIFEDQYGVGDEVDLGEAGGTVEAVGLRVTRVRDVNGTVWYVRNGEILRVGNMSQNWARAVLDVQIPYGENIANVRRILTEVSRSLWEDEEFRDIIIEQPSVWGVQDLQPDAVSIRIAVKTAPLQQWAVARTLRERIKGRFDHEGIGLQVAQKMVWESPDDDPPDDPADGPADGPVNGPVDDPKAGPADKAAQ